MNKDILNNNEVHLLIYLIGATRKHEEDKFTKLYGVNYPGDRVGTDNQGIGSFIHSQTVKSVQEQCNDEISRGDIKVIKKGLGLTVQIETGKVNIKFTMSSNPKGIAEYSASINNQQKLSLDVESHLPSEIFINVGSEVNNILDRKYVATIQKERGAHKNFSIDEGKELDIDKIKRIIEIAELQKITLKEAVERLFNPSVPVQEKKSVRKRPNITLKSDKENIDDLKTNT